MPAKMLIKPIGGLETSRIEADADYVEKHTKFVAPVEILGTKDEIKAFLFANIQKFFTSDAKAPLSYRVHEHTPVQKKLYKPVKVGTGATALTSMVINVGKFVVGKIAGVTMELEITDHKVEGWKDGGQGDLNFGSLINKI